jgi:hypothetical protein
MHDPERPAWRGMRIVGMVILGVVTAVVFGFAFGYFVQLLWNWLMPEIFHLTKITYWQAFGLVLLARLIFGSIGHHERGHHPGHNLKHHHHNRKHYREWKRDDWMIKGGWKNWDYYDGWWREEGKAAFENYIDRMSNESKEEK